MPKARFIFLLILLFAASCANKYPLGKLDENNPIMDRMPNTNADMETSGYWIAKAKTPDALIMTKAEIEQFNYDNVQYHDIVVVSEYDTIKDGEFLSKSMLSLYNYIAARKYYFKNGKKVDKKELLEAYKQLNVEPLINNPRQEYEIRFGVVTSRVSQKVLPVSESYYREGNGYFDRLQMSSLDIGTPVAILWKSLDEKWLYVRSPITVGWVPVDDVAYCKINDIKKWENPTDFVIVTDYRGEIYSDASCRKFSTWVPLGLKLPLDTTRDKITKKMKPRIENGVAVVLIPYKDRNGQLMNLPSYIPLKSVSVGYVPYTSRNMLDLAFKFLHAPYGWGGMESNQDCSGFMIQLFNSVGILLPRNSGSQALIGDSIYEPSVHGERKARVYLSEYGIPGATILQMPGHIMLYIGEHNGKVYAIHAMWSFEGLNEKNKPVKKIVGRVLVSTLEMSEHSPKGAYHDRLRNVRIIQLNSGIFRE